MCGKCQGPNVFLELKQKLNHSGYFLSSRVLISLVLVLHNTSSLWLVRRLQLERSGRYPGKAYLRAILCQGLLQVIITDKGLTYHLNLLHTDDGALGTGRCWAFLHLLRKRCEKLLLIIVKY